MRISGFSWGLALLSIGLLAGCGVNQSEKQSQSQQQTSRQQGTTKSVTATTKVSLTAAIKIFQQQFTDASITGVELKRTLGRPVYKIEGVGGTTAHELQLNAQTGKIISKDSEQLDQDDQNEAKTDQLNLNNLISPSKAVAIAVHDMSGGHATELQLDKTSGITYWEVEVHKGQQQVDVKIDAHKGSILETEHDD